MTKKELQKALAKLAKKKGLEYHLANDDGNIITVRFWIEDKEEG